MATKTKARRLSREEYKAEFDRNTDAFKAMHPQLLKKYKGQCVAIYNGEVVDHGPDERELWARMREHYGDHEPWIVQPVVETIFPVYIVEHAE